MRVVKLSPEDWEKYSADAHRACFGEERPASMNRIDFALVVEENDLPLCYMTVRETDSLTAYMQYGGAFPSAKGKPKSLLGYLMMVDFLSQTYTFGSTLIENTNTPMMKFAMKAGLKIIGLRNFNNHILLEHFVQWRN